MFRQGGLTPSVTETVEFIAEQEERGDDEFLVNEVFTGLLGVPPLILR